MNCPACDKPLTERTGTATVKVGRRRVPYEFRYLTCGSPGHAWQTEAMTEATLQTVARIKAAEQKFKRANR